MVPKFTRSSFSNINGTEIFKTELKQNVLLWGFPGLPARPYEALDSAELCTEMQFLPYRDQQFVSVIKTGCLVLFSEIIDVSCKKYTEHINTLCGQNAEFANVHVCGTYGNQFVLKGYKLN